MLKSIVPAETSMHIVEKGVVEMERMDRKHALSREILDKLKDALNEAEDMDTINKLERALKTGEISDEIASMIGLK